MIQQFNKNITEFQTTFENIKFLFFFNLDIDINFFNHLKSRLSSKIFSNSSLLKNYRSSLNEIVVFKSIQRFRLQFFVSVYQRFNLSSTTSEHIFLFVFSTSIFSILRASLILINNIKHVDNLLFKQQFNVVNNHNNNELINTRQFINYFINLTSTSIVVITNNNN